MSGWWFVTLVELKSPKDRLYLKDGTESKGLRKARSQLADWLIWRKRHPTAFRSELAKLVTKLNSPQSCSGYSDAASEVLDPRMEVSVDEQIFIGRRGALSFEDQARRVASYPSRPDTIATYDRILDCARAFERKTKG